MPITKNRNDIGICPNCGNTDCECAHETINAEGQLLVWSECPSCKKQFVEVFERVGVLDWRDLR